MGLESDLTLQKYRVLADENGKPLILGQGAMGTAYMAVDPVLDRKVVLKLIKPELVSDDTVRKRFLREAKAAASLMHPNVAGIFEFCEEDDMIFYAMEFIEGRNLAQVVAQDGPIEAEPALKIARKVALALKAAEAKHLVHRDIKPSNIMLQDSVTGGEPTVKLIDFGLAKALTTEGSDGLMLTKHGFVGTPVFASPEQLEEKDLDIRSDIYSLGVTLWYTMKGEAPFQATSLAGLIRAHLSERPNFEEFAAVEPMPVCELLEKMLAKSPDDRQANAGALLEEIEDCLKKIRTPVAPPAAPPSPPSPPEPEEALPPDAGEEVFDPYVTMTKLPTAGKQVPRDTGAVRGAGNRSSTPESKTAAGAPPPEVSASSVPAPPSAKRPPTEAPETAAASQRESTGPPGPRFEIVEEIFKDPWGPVYRGREVETGDSVVLHEVQAKLIQEPRRRAALEDFVRRAGAIEHRNILYYERVEYGEQDGPAYIVGEYWESIRLQDILDARRRFGVREALILLEDIGLAADFCAANGFRDPDLDPFRILLPIPRIWSGSTTREQLTKIPINDWPEVTPLIVPFSFKDVLGNAGKSTAFGTAFDTSRSYVQRIALLFYQLLGGSPADVKKNRYKDIPDINAEVNGILRDCIEDDSFATAAELLGSMTGKHTYVPGVTRASTPKRKKKRKKKEVSSGAVKWIAAAVVVLGLIGAAVAGVVNEWIPNPFGNKPPVVVADALEATQQFDLLAGAPTEIAGDVLENDHDPNKKDELVVTEVNGDEKNVGRNIDGKFGVIRIEGEGKFTYTPKLISTDPGVAGALSVPGKEEFVYTVSDGEESVSGSLTIDVFPPKIPIFRQEKNYSGLLLEPLPAWCRDVYGIETGAVVVVGVLKNSPAEVEGIKPGSIVTRWDAVPFSDTVMPFRKGIIEKNPGATLRLDVLERAEGDSGKGKAKEMKVDLQTWMGGQGEGAISDLAASDVVRLVPDSAIRSRWFAAWGKNGLSSPEARADLAKLYRETAQSHFGENKKVQRNLEEAAVYYESLGGELAIARAAGLSTETMAWEVAPAVCGGVSAMRRLGEAYAASTDGGPEAEKRARVWLEKAVEGGDAGAASLLAKLGDGKLQPVAIDPPLPEDDVDRLIETFAFDKAKALLAERYPDASEAGAVYLKKLRTVYLKRQESGDHVRAANVLEEFDRSLHADKSPDRDALRFLFDQYDDLEDAKGAANTLKELVSRDDPDPELFYFYAAAHEEGELFKKDLAVALAYYEKARAAGYAPALKLDEAIGRLKAGGMGTVAEVGVDFVNSEGIVMAYGGKTSAGDNHFWMSKELISTSSSTRDRMTSADRSAGKLPQGFTVNTPREKVVDDEGKEYAYYTSNSNSRKLVLVPLWEREPAMVKTKPKTPEDLERARMLAEEKRKEEEERKKKAEEERLRMQQEEARRMAEQPVVVPPVVLPPETEKPAVVEPVSVPSGRSFTNAAGISMMHKPKSARGNPFWESSSAPSTGGLSLDQFCVRLTYNERISGSLPSGHIYTKSSANPGRIVLLNASAEGLMNYSSAPVAQWVKGSGDEVVSPHSGKRLKVSGQPWTVQREGSLYFLLPSRDNVSSKPSLADVTPPPPRETPVVRPEVVTEPAPPPPPPIVVEQEEEIDPGKNFTNSRGMKMEYRSKSAKGHPFWRSTGSAGVGGDALNRLCVELSYKERRSGRIPSGYVYAPSSGSGGKIVLLHSAKEGIPNYGSMSLGEYASGRDRSEVISPYTGKRLRVSGQAQPWSLVREGNSTFILPP